MDWKTYQRLCGQPDVFSRWMLCETAALMEDRELAARILAPLGRTPFEKPADFRGGAATDMFAVDLSRRDVQRIEIALRGARACGRALAHTPGRGLGGFVEAWAEYGRTLSLTEGA
jgi:hypothetical protein